MLDTLYSQIGLLPMVLVGIFAFTKGDEPERLAMGAYLLGWMAGLLLQDDQGLHSNWQPGMFALDVVMLLVLGGLAWKFHRNWPIWAAALQLIIVMSHLVILFDMRGGMMSFYTIVNLAGYGVLLAIGLGTFWAWQERRAAGLE
ncbi:hypothetical protein [Brevundimonas sp.]|uniref:hypothetical protein n=1 Tax=Brevundimonas sp. TaxID=1871086 RepID=UPI00286B5889|nr:hypothetical protein [Brevundimonas sp.]